MLGHSQVHKYVIDLLAPEFRLVQGSLDVLSGYHLHACHQITAGIIGQSVLYVERFFQFVHREAVVGVHVVHCVVVLRCCFGGSYH